MADDTLTVALWRASRKEVYTNFNPSNLNFNKSQSAYALTMHLIRYVRLISSLHMYVALHRGP